MHAKLPQDRQRGSRTPSVQGRQDQNAGHRSLASDRGGFGVSNFPDTQNVGILSQHTAKCRSECKPCFALYLNLIGSGQQPLNRIFDGDQAAICRIQFFQ